MGVFILYKFYYIRTRISPKIKVEEWRLNNSTVNTQGLLVGSELVTSYR